MGMLAVAVAHELRNPLAVIRAATYNIKIRNKNPILTKHLDHIEEKILESNHIINNLLNYAKIRMPKYAKVAVYHILNECIDDARKRFPGKSIRLVKKIDSIKGLIIDADPVQMQEIFCNLVTNSFQSIVGKGTVWVTAQVDQKTHVLEVTFKDTGIGIDKKDLGRIFEPFFTRKENGTGLGLTICNELVNLHFGRIDLVSEKNKGATFTVRIPTKVRSYPSL